ncbi:MAG: cytochrome b/b6 domain-containing protein, partial [Pseudomonadota bacterium]
MTDHASTTQPVQIYSAAARAFHWLTALGIAMLIASGLWMTARSDANIWDATTNALYSGHKLLGFVVLWLVVARLVYRLVRGAPDDAPSLSPAQRVISHVVHWSLYGLLLMIPILGWLGVSAFPALTVFGIFDLPSIAAVDQAQAKQYFEWH